jgi:3-oxoadipate enol-lactonase
MMIQFVQANGIKVAYRMDGPPNGPVVVLSNSLMSSHAMWDANMSALTDKYRVLRYDTRGHGQSEVTPGPYSIAMLGDDLVALLDALKIPKAHLVGLSMGGMICQYVAANHSSRVISLGLCDTASEMPPRSLWEDRFATARAQGIEGLVEGTIKRWFVAGFVERTPLAIAEVKKMILATPLEGYIGCASAVRDMAQTTMLLKIKAPTLVLLGREDPACTLAQATVLHRVIDGSELAIIDDAAHLSNIEKPEEFNFLLRKFLDRN